MTTIQWWRSWHGAPIDHKWSVIAAKAGVKVGIVSAIAWALMDYASQHNPRGCVSGFDTETYAVYSGFPESEIIAVMQAMSDKSVLVDGKFSNWEKRQPKREDDSTPRVREHRNALKHNVTQGNIENESETFSSLSSSVSVSESVSLSNEVIEDKSDDKFDEIQRHLERQGILVNTPDAIMAVENIIAMNATIEDVQNGVEWKKRNNDKKFIYASSIVNPTRTAMQKRLQNGNGHKPSVHVYAETYE